MGRGTQRKASTQQEVVWKVRPEGEMLTAGYGFAIKKKRQLSCTKQYEE
jgi:hypothetical protein